MLACCVIHSVSACILDVFFIIDADHLVTYVFWDILKVYSLILHSFKTFFLFDHGKVSMCFAFLSSLVLDPGIIVTSIDNQYATSYEA